MNYWQYLYCVGNLFVYVVYAHTNIISMVSGIGENLIRTASLYPLFPMKSFIDLFSEGSQLCWLLYKNISSVSSLHSENGDGFISRGSRTNSGRLWNQIKV